MQDNDFRDRVSIDSPDTGQHYFQSEDKNRIAVRHCSSEVAIRVYMKYVLRRKLSGCFYMELMAQELVAKQVGLVATVSPWIDLEKLGGIAHIAEYAHQGLARTSS